MHARKLGWILLLTVLIAALALAGCAKKSTGDDDDDTADDDDAPPSGVGAYDVSLNMVPTTLGEFVEPTARQIYDADDAVQTVETITLAEWLGAIEAFAADMDSFDYEPLNFYEKGTAAKIGPDELESVVFFENGEDGGLCLAWLEAGHGVLCDMADGAIVTHPRDGAFTMRTPAYINERTGDQPTHLGETVAFTEIVTTGANVIVSGSYLKTYLQRDGWGIKVFADAGATETSQGYDGTLIGDIDTYAGDELFVLARVTVHDETIELVPKSAYHVAVLSTGNAVEEPTTLTIDQLQDDPYRYDAALVRVDDVEIVDVNPDDPTTDWPDYGTKSKDISIRHTSGGSKLNLAVYERTGLPGSSKPEAGFDVVGVAELDAGSMRLMPRRVEDINPTNERLAGTIHVTISAEDAAGDVDLADLPCGQQPLGEKGALVPVVSLAEVAHAAGVTRWSRRLEYKTLAYDGRQPFDTLLYDEFKSGVLYQGTPTEPDEPDPMVNSYFWDQMGLSEIFFLNGVTAITGFRAVEPPQEGEAEYGEGVTLKINGKSFAILFDSLAQIEYEGKPAIRAAELVSDQVIGEYTMSGFFTVDQIKLLYDYRFVSNDEADEATVRYADLENGYVILEDDPYVIFPDLGASYRVDQVLVVDMMRYMQVDFGDGSDPTVVYLRDCETSPVDIGDGTMEEAVFFSTVLEHAGVDTSQNMYLYTYWLIASDEFASTWDYGHGHLEAMYFRPDANEGYTTDPGVGAYGGRVSTKAVYEIEFHEVPQAAPSVAVIVNDETVWGSDANTCEGCHLKSGSLNIPIDCTTCHEVP